ncbi:MAG: hypothetical protein HY924_08785 [Elusimicrobia bacterium]|nr:hypothetical protein [Elusimicrobiota bacterium]
MLLLFLLHLFGLRLNLLSAGFYIDDWWLISMAGQGSRFIDGVRAFMETGFFWDRPLEMLHDALILRLSGPPAMDHAWVPQLVLGSLELAESFLLFLLLKRLLDWRGLALLAAGLIALYPNRGGFHYRPNLVCQHLSQTLILASILVHAHWWRSRRWPALAASQALYAMALLSYEAAMFMPLMLGGAVAGRALAEGGGRAETLKEVLKGLLPYAVVLAVLLLWKWAGIPFLMGSHNPKSGFMALSPSQALKTLAAGAGCVTLWPLSLSAVRLLDAGRELGWLLIFAPLAAGLAAAALRLKPEDGPEDASASAGALAGAVAAAFLGAYAPFLLAESYLPYVNGVMSRVNGAGAWTGGLLLAAFLWALSRRASGRVPFVAPWLLLTAFTWTNWVEADAWSRAWAAQKDILSRLAPHTARLHDSNAVLLAGAPRFIHGAPVFDSDYDLNPALRVTFGRKDLHGNVLTPRMTVEGAELVERYRGREVHRYPVSSLVIYDYGADRIIGAADVAVPALRETGFLSKLFLGPGMEP